jgi:flagellar biosynthesis/type III secretory pathway protein FliH
MESYSFPSLEGAWVAAKGATPAERAAEIVARARVAAATAAAQAEVQGREAGYAAGLEEGRAQVTNAAAALSELGDELASAAYERGEQLERQAVVLALALAEKILGTALELRPELVVDVVTGALRGLLERGRVVIEVSPDDVELVTGALPGVSEAAGGLGQIDVVAERRVARGGCIVHTEEAEIDGTIAAQLERAGEIMREAMSAADAR